jgi:transglutaminase-like putative cysteine protease
MPAAVPDAAILAERFLRVALIGPVVAGFLALGATGYFERSDLVWIGLGELALLAVCGVIAGKLRRGYGVVVILAFLELLAAAVLSTSLAFFLFLTVFLVLLVAALAGSELRRSSKGPYQVARGGLGGFHPRLAQVCVFVAGGILVITAGLFLVLPRTAHAAFSHFFAGRNGGPGFSREVRLGQAGSSIKRNSAAMQVRIVDAPALPWARWRGAVLDSFDGRRWSAASASMTRWRASEGPVILADDTQRRRPGARITYEVRLEPAASGALYFPGVAEVLWTNSRTVTGTAAGIYRLEPSPQGRLRYGAVSYLGAPMSGDAPQAADLALPPLDPRIGALARRIAGGIEDVNGRAQAVTRYLLDKYSYTADQPEADSADPLARFLFDSRKGHCEYFASALAVMLRSLGIPARLATGFVGGTLNPVSGWYVFRGADAHSWVEVWLPERGWATFDPTPTTRSLTSQSLLARLMFQMDAADMFWQDWVVDYDLERQVSLAARVQDSGRSMGGRWLDKSRQAWLNKWSGAKGLASEWGVAVAVTAAGLVLLTLAAPAGWRLIDATRRLRRAKRGNAAPTDAALLYERMLRILRRQGHSKSPAMTALEFSQSLPSSTVAAIVARFTAAYHDLRYGGRVEAAREMAAMLEELSRHG